MTIIQTRGGNLSDVLLMYHFVFTIFVGCNYCRNSHFLTHTAIAVGNNTIGV